MAPETATGKAGSACDYDFAAEVSLFFCRSNFLLFLRVMASQAMKTARITYGFVKRPK